MLVTFLLGWLLGLASLVVAALLLALLALRRKPDHLSALDREAYAEL